MEEQRDYTIQEMFPDLDEKSFKLLAFIAYYGECPNAWMTKKLTGFVCSTEQELQDSLQNLRRRGYLENDKVSPRHFFQVVTLQQMRYRSWEEQFSALSLFRYESSKMLWNIGRKIANKDIKHLAWSLRSGLSDDRVQLNRYIGQLALDSYYDPLIELLNETEFTELIDSLLTEKISDDSLDKQTIERIRGIINTSKHCSAELQDMVSFYTFLMTGKSDGLVEQGQRTKWGICHQAIKALYDSRADDARTLFRLALNTGVTGKLPPEVFRSPLLNFYYGLTLMKLSSSPAMKDSALMASWLSAFSKNRSIYYSKRNNAIRILITYFNSGSINIPKFIEEQVETMLKEDSSPLSRGFATLILSYFKLIDVPYKDNYDLSRIPKAAFLRHELSPFVPMKQEEREELHHDFTGKPVLVGIRRKEAWENVFQDIRANIRSGFSESLKKQKRVIYIFKGLWLDEIREQTLKEDGTWSFGKSLPRKQFMNSGFDSMDDLDRKVAASLRDRIVDVPEAGHVFPFMSGTDRVFVLDKPGEYNSPEILSPAIVAIEKPYISFTAVGNSVNIASNVNLRSDGKTIASADVTLDEDGTYRMKLVDDIQKSFLEPLLQIRTIPVSAVTELKTIIERMEEVIEVRSDLKNIESIPQTKGDDVIAVRITPYDGEYLLRVQAAPLRDGSLRFPAGEGEDIIYDQADGRTHMVIRSLEDEYRNYEMLRDYLEEKCHNKFDDYEHMTISTAESLLNLLSYTFENQERYILEWPEGKELKFKGIVEPKDINIIVKSNQKWFEMHGKVNLSGKEYTLHDLLEMQRGSKGDGYIKIGDNEYMKMCETLRKQISQMESLDRLGQSKGGVQRVPTYQIGHLASILGQEGGLNSKVDKKFNDMLKQMRDAYKSEPELPSGLNCTLKDYQVEGFKWMKRLSCWGAGACLADDMGVGKTVQTIAFLLDKASEGASLVVVPKSLLLNWEMEIRRFAPSLNPIILNNIKDKERVVSEAGNNDIFIVTYGVLVTQRDTLVSHNWNVVCLDEAHQIKNRSTQASICAMDLKAEHRVILTGTPVQNHLGELWNLFQFINPGMLGTWSEFQGKYMTGSQDDDSAQDLRDITQPFILRRTKQDVLDDLPDKISHDRLVELSEEEMIAYEENRKRVESYLNATKKARKGMVKVDFFAELTKLRLLSNSISLVYPDWTRESSKMKELKKLISLISDEDNNRILIFSQFTSFLGQIANELKGMGLDYLYLDGSTPLDKRQSQVEAFQRGECPIFLISLKAGGLGLNLTAANYVIMMDPWWNPAIENQATDRAYRIGQDRNVTVIRLIAKHTIEEKILQIHEVKQNLSDEILEGTSESSKLTMDDILEMVSPFR